jgi:hypothetical protein
MSTSAFPSVAQPAALESGAGSTKIPASTCIGQAYTTTFGMPSGIKLSQFDGIDWSNWSGMLEAVLTLHEAEDVTSSQKIWHLWELTKQKMGLHPKENESIPPICQT